MAPYDALQRNIPKKSLRALSKIRMKASIMCMIALYENSPSVSTAIMENSNT
jgi:hypothetical protein